MQVSLVSCRLEHVAPHARPRQDGMPLRFAPAAGLAGSRADGEWQRHYRHAAAALGDARARAELAERRLHSRLAELAWPAALGGIVAGFAAVFAMRLAGL